MSSMRRFSNVAIAVLTLIAPATGALAQEPAPPRNDAASESQWIVTLNPEVEALRHAAALARAAGGESGDIFQHVLNGFVFRGSNQAAEALANNPNVRTIVPDGVVSVTSETVPFGVRRIQARHPTKSDAHEAGFDGAGIRIAILDTGIDLAHPDLVANLDTDLGVNCLGVGPPQDGHGHGTHVAGIAAGVGGNGEGIVGVAHSARLVPVKVLDDSGFGTTSQVICGIDHITGLTLDGDPANDVRVANMSLGEEGVASNCQDGALREAVCNSTAAGIIYIAAAGNSTIDATGFVPAAYPEVITVSAITDLDGEPGGNAGCLLFFIYCDDTFAEYSNYGDPIDVTAPGTEIYSTWVGGGYQNNTGTSMAAPHVAGVAALVVAENPSLTRNDVEEILEVMGECPDGTWADDANGDCVGHGRWANDPDNTSEPLVNALRSAQVAATWNPRPTISITSPADGAAVSGVVQVTVEASDDVGVATVDFFVNDRLVFTDSDPADGWSMAWDSSVMAGGVYTVTATATDTDGASRSDQVSVSVGTNPQGDWVGSYGVDGYALLAWNGTGDLVSLPQASLSLDVGSRDSQGSTTDVRALESPDELERRATGYWDLAQIRFRLTFDTAYAGDLHLYAMDWASFDRRQTVTVDDGSGLQTVNLSTSFHDGAWMHFPISVAAAGTVTVTVDHVAGANALINGVFLGGGGAAEPLPSPEAPAAPTLTAVADASAVDLSWTAPADGGSSITGYNIYRGTSSGSASLYATVGDVLAYTDTVVTPGVTYYYQVTAVNDIGEGSRSNEVSVIPLAPPGAPDNVSAATASRGKGVVLSWSEPSLDGGSPVTGYLIYRGISPGEEALLVEVGTVTNYQDRSTSKSVVYYYRISAVNAVGEGDLSPTVSAAAK
ncbi:MAG TPA: S8 family serine peptidase [Acidimicrobiia bacterium]|nr:S8 family serine peptidase [Acidimicrobiia bacterium]